MTARMTTMIGEEEGEVAGLAMTAGTEATATTAATTTSNIVVAAQAAATSTGGR
jgi:hypothetical protein